MGGVINQVFNYRNGLGAIPGAGGTCSDVYRPTTRPRIQQKTLNNSEKEA